MRRHQRQLPPQSRRAVPRPPDRCQARHRLGPRTRRGVRADPSTLIVAGSSAGGHLASIAALTPNAPRFQPGFEHADTSVTAAISLYGYNGRLHRYSDADNPTASSIQDYVRADAPPFFVAHGDQDTIVLVEDARAFVESLRRVSRSPVLYAELPGAQHTFDFFHSLRSEKVIEG